MKNHQLKSGAKVNKLFDIQIKFEKNFPKRKSGAFQIVVFIPFHVLFGAWGNPREQGRCICGAMEQAPMLVVEIINNGETNNGACPIATGIHIFPVPIGRTHRCAPTNRQFEMHPRKKAVTKNVLPFSDNNYKKN
jgi:hypothetical protein